MGQPGYSTDDPITRFLLPTVPCILSPVSMPSTTYPHLMIFLWLFPTAIEIGIVLAVLHRGLWRHLPIFFTSMIIEIGRTAFLFLERKNVYVYFYGYWVTELLGCLMILWVSKELFDNVFSRHLGLRRLGNILFKGSLLVGFVSAALWSRILPAMDTAHILSAILLLKRAVTFVQTGMLASFFIFSFALGLAWDHYVKGVALGFGLYGAAELSAMIARTIYGRAAGTLVNWIIMSANNCCILIWAYYFLFPAKMCDNPATATPDRQMLREWNDMVVALLRNPLRWLHARRLS